MRVSEVVQLCLTLSDPMDCSLPGSSVHGSFQARVLEWVAISFSTMDMSLGKLWELVMDREACGEGSGTPLQYSCLENPMDGGAS